MWDLFLVASGVAGAVAVHELSHSHVLALLLALSGPVFLTWRTARRAHRTGAGSADVGATDGPAAEFGVHADSVTISPQHYYFGDHVTVHGGTGNIGVLRGSDVRVAPSTAPLRPPRVWPRVWGVFRRGRATADLGETTDALAAAVRKQWNAEAAIRRLNDPYPLPVAWKAADPDLVEDWPLLERTARAWPGGPPGAPERWSADDTGLAGSDAQISEVFTERVPTRRLVILGEPGSGKTMLLIRLLQDLNERRTPGCPVPVLFTLASWNPAEETLNEWLASQLRQIYPGLRASAPGRQGDLAQAMLDAGRILPLLDGFDELPSAVHELCFDTINRDLPARAPLVLASRVAAYRETVTRPDATMRLNGAAGIHLLPLAPQDAAAYLRRDAGGPHAPAADRWAAVTTRLGTDTPLGQALATPLGLFLARTIYNPRPDTALTERGAAPHPEELCAFSTRAALNTHLFGAFLRAAYAPHGANPPRWTAHQAHRAHAFLARHLENDRNGSPDLAWWEFRRTIHTSVFRLAFGLLAALAIVLATTCAFTLRTLVHGLVVGLVHGPVHGLAHGLALGLVHGLGFGLVLGVVAALACARPTTPSVHPRWSFRRFATGFTRGLVLGGLVSGLIFMLAVGLSSGLEAGITAGIRAGLWIGVTGGLVGGLAVGPAIGLVLGFGAEKPDPATAIGAARLLIRDRRTFITALLPTWLLAAALAPITVSPGSPSPLNGLATGGVILPGIGLVVALRQANAWTSFKLSTSLLALRREVPWNLMAFLQDAHENRGVLRQVGAVYQFRHLDLQRHLAQSDVPPPER